ncbi:ROK family transcriptional regulator [Oceanispirochaeta sp.]|uniref:ROK family transcriptional regulator n=1 Tax=Oceanispirochaeta sp. TaxID=2035350 RepID=UPI00261C7530|nr:ROK family transcriptional regulator [Oceanispirochaeta sp.]MDA3957278.1 ROK family transcriptional regulator [Oceanispirochaeta sp.]
MAVKNRLKRDNILRVLETLWRNPGRSRADLARELRLDRSTVGSLVDWMIDSRLIEESRDTSSSPRGGRPAVLLRIRGGYAYAIGVELTVPSIRLYAGDLNGSLLDEKEITISSYGPGAIDSLAVELARFRKYLDHKYPMEAGLTAVGLGVSGVVDDDKKEIILSNALRIHESLSVAEPLKTVLNVPIVLFNDAQACALGEANRLQKKDLILVLIEKRSTDPIKDIGVGIGIVNHDKLMNGRAITHLLQPSHNPTQPASEQFITKLGRSLALIANVTGTNDIILGGDVDDYLEDLTKEIIRNISGEGDPSGSGLLVHATSEQGWSVAAGAHHSAIRQTLHKRCFPLGNS